MTMMSPENYSNLLDPVLRKVFFTTLTEQEKKEDFKSILFDVTTSRRSIERVLGLGGLSDVPDFTGTFTEDTPSQQYLKTFTHAAYGKMINISNELLEDDLYDQIKRYPQMLAIAYYRTQQKHAATVFNNAFSTTLTADALSLCNTAHTSASPDGVNQSNSGTSALTYANLIATLNLMKQFKDDRGELMHIQGDTLLVPLGLRQTATEILESSLQPYTTDNTANVANRTVYGNPIKLLVWDRLTDSNNWFVLDSQLGKMHNHWFNRVGPESKTVYDHDRRASKFSIYGRWSYGPSDWRWIYGHNVS